MQCSKCSASYDTLACPVCTARASRRAVLDHQQRYIDGVLAGKTPLHTVSRGFGQLPHVELFDFPGFAWCGALLSGSTRRATTVYGALLRKEMCGACRDALDSVAAARTPA